MIHPTPKLTDQELAQHLRSFAVGSMLPYCLIYEAIARVLERKPATTLLPPS